MITDNIHALSVLLHDPDEHIFESICKDLFVCGAAQAIPVLKQVKWQTLDSLALQRIDFLLDEFAFEEIKTDLTRWCQNFDDDWIEPLYLVSRLTYTNLLKEDISAPIGQLKAEFWIENNSSLNVLQQTKILYHLIYKKNEFSSRVHDDADLSNYCMNDVLYHKTANDLMISILFVILAQSQQIPAKVVNLNNHFLLALMSKEDTYDFSNVLFFFNPFFGGTTFLPKHLEEIFLNNQMGKVEDLLMIYDPKQVITYLFQQLNFIYRKQNDTMKIQQTASLIQILKSFD